MKQVKEINLLIITLMAAVTLSACGGGAKQTDETSQTDATEVAANSVAQYPIPTSFEVTKMLNKAGASYILSLNNPVENVDKYFTLKSRALNLGVYGANLSYASTYQMKQETMNYFNVAKRLIDELQITTAFNAKFAERVQTNIDNKDSLIHIISQSFFDTYQFLMSNGKDNVSLLVMGGSWVEGLYITTQIASITKDNTDFIKIIASQKDPLNNLMELMVKNESDQMVAEVIALLKPLQDVFAGVTTDSLSKEQIEKITQLATSIREEIIKG